MAFRDRIVDALTRGKWSEVKALERQMNEVLGSQDEAKSGQSLSQKFSHFNAALDFRTASALANVFTTVQSHRSEIIKAVDDVKHFYLAQAIIDQIAEDALMPDVSTNEVINVTSKKTNVNKAIKELEERIGRFDVIVNDIRRDLLAYGEYTLRPVVDGPAEPSQDLGMDGDDQGAEDQRKKSMVSDPEGRPVDVRNGSNGSSAGKEQGGRGRGVLSIHDDVDQDSVVAITENGQVTGYLVVDKNQKGMAQRAAIKPPSAFVKFTLNGAKVRVKLTDDPIFKTIRNSEFGKRVPRYVRVGRSILFPVLSKIKELQLLEQLVPATKIQMLTAGTIIGMQVPTAYDVNKGFEAAQQAEELINKKVGVDTANQQINVENILSTVGRVKIVPQFGEKGQLQKYDYKPEEPTDLLESIEDLRRVILSSVGVPYELIFGAESAESKGELLKRYARYLRRLKTIQQSIADGIRQIVEIHLVNAGVDFVPSEDVQIEFRNKLIQVDLLDELEFMDTTVGMLGNTLRFLGVEEQFMSKIVSFKDLVEFLQDKMQVLGMGNVLDAKKAQDLENAEQESDDATASGGGPPPDGGASEPEPVVQQEEPNPVSGGNGGNSGSQSGEGT